MWYPESAESIEPLVDILQCPAIHRVQPPLAVGAYRSETIVPQNFQMLRNRRLANRELILDGRGDVTCRHLTVGKEFQNAAPHWLPQDVERVHTPKLKYPLI